MRSDKSIFLLILIFLLSASASFGQSKKALKQEIAQLQANNNQLTLDNTVLEQEKTALTTQNQSLSAETLALKTQVAGLQDDVDDCNQDYSNLMSDYQALIAGGTGGSLTGGGSSSGGSSGTTSGGSSGTTTGGTTGVTPTPISGDSRTCAQMQNTLAAGKTYRMNYTVLNSSGWGVQVYSFSSLCQAEAKAAAFKKQFTMYDTYIKVKTVGTKKLFAVVYGNMNDKAQAGTYLKNFKKIAKDNAQKKAFLVQH